MGKTARHMYFIVEWNAAGFPILSNVCSVSTSLLYQKYDIVHLFLFFADNRHGFYYHKGYKFSTFDHDEDASNDSCADLEHGGWWYRDCGSMNLNGEYISPPGGQSSISVGLGGFVYYAWKNAETLKSSQIMFRKHDWTTVITAKIHMYSHRCIKKRWSWKA